MDISPNEIGTNDTSAAKIHIDAIVIITTILVTHRVYLKLHKLKFMLRQFFRESIDSFYDWPEARSPARPFTGHWTFFPPLLGAKPNCKLKTNLESTENVTIDTFQIIKQIEIDSNGHKIGWQEEKVQYPQDAQASQTIKHPLNVHTDNDNIDPMKSENGTN